MQHQRIFIVIIFLLVSCKAYAQQSISVGGEKDTHGCLPAAGYTWSELKKECVRLWDVGFKMIPVDKTSTFAAYVILSADKKLAEVFLAESKSYSLMMKMVKANVYTYGKYKLDVSKEKYILSKNNKVIYRNE